jgi:hypothetical protein
MPSKTQKIIVSLNITDLSDSVKWQLSQLKDIKNSDPEGIRGRSHNNKPVYQGPNL